MRWVLFAVFAVKSNQVHNTMLPAFQQTATEVANLPSPDSLEHKVYMIVTLGVITATRLSKARVTLNEGSEKRVCAGEALPTRAGGVLRSQFD